MVDKVGLGRSVSPYSLLDEDQATDVYEDIFEREYKDPIVVVHGGPQSDLRLELGLEAHDVLEDSELWVHESYGEIEEADRTFNGENTLEELKEVFLESYDNDIKKSNTLFHVSSDYHTDRIYSELEKFSNDFVVLGVPWNSLKREAKVEALEGLKTKVPQDYKDLFREKFGRPESVYR